MEQKARVIRIPLSQTIAFQSDRRKVEALLEEDFVAFYGRIDEVCRELPSCFIRIHNRYIVNLNYVTTLEKDRCILGSRSFPVSRAFRQELETAFARAMLK
ncbi:LytTR family transcriptional regulator [Blautia sp. RD014234]|nr:LytTR family transcriptional regulator [Blautia parvula]